MFWNRRLRKLEQRITALERETTIRVDNYNYTPFDRAPRVSAARVLRRYLTENKIRVHHTPARAESFTLEEDQ